MEGYRAREVERIHDRLNAADARAREAEVEAERLRAEWRKADDGWIACQEQLRGAVEALAEDGDFVRWAQLQHLDRRNGTTEARDAIAAFLGGRS